MKIFKLFLLLFMLSSVSYGQYTSNVTVPEAPIANYDSLRKVNIEAKYAATITAEEMKNHLTIIASDDFAGRELGTEGNKMAGSYISQQFSRMGLPAIGTNDSYYQPVAFTYTKWQELSLSIAGETKKNLSDYISFPLRNNDAKRINSDEILFVGYGISSENYDDYGNTDVKDKVILIYPNEPKDAEGNSQVTGTSEVSDWSYNLEKKLELAGKKGAKLVLIVDDSLKTHIAENRRALLRKQMTLGESESVAYANSMMISTKLLAEILGSKKKKFVKKRDKMNLKGKSKPLKLKVHISAKQVRSIKTVPGNNVLGFVEGSDPKVKDEVIVVSAHYDHIGTAGAEINNGANDNGSGTTTVIELAEAFAEAKFQGHGPSRSILFLLVTGEEKGLLGSYYYGEHPIFPLENTVANVNIDMVGRIHEKYEDNPHYIYVIGSDRLSTDLHKINEQKNAEFVNLTLDYKYNDENDPNRFYFRSDHYNFAKFGIPAIFFFNGTHADYHRPTDTVEKINFEEMESIGRHIFHLTWELSNRKDRIRVDRS